MREIQKIISVLLVFCLILVIFPLHRGSPAAAASYKTEPIELVIDWQRSVPNASPWILGINISSDLRKDNISDYSNILEYVSPSLMRYIAPSLGQWYNSRKKEWNLEAIQSYFSLIDSIGDKIVCLPIWEKGSWLDSNADGLLDNDKVDVYAKLCAQLVKLISKNYDNDIMYWEIPSGPEGLYFINSRDGKVYERAEALAHIFFRVSSEMKAADPSINIGISVPAKTEFYNGFEHFLHELVDRGAHNMNFISLCSYAFVNNNTGNKDLYNEVYNPQHPNSSTIIKRIKDIQNIVKRQAPSHGIQVFLGEYGIAGSSSNHGSQFKSWVEAAFNALVIAYAYDAGIPAIAACNRMNSSTHVLQLLNNYLSGTKVWSQSQDATKIFSLAVMDNNTKTRSYMVINRSDDVQLIDIRFMQSIPHGRSIQEHQISEGGYTIRSSSWNKVVNNIIAVPAHSVTLWTDSQIIPTILPPAIPVIQPHSGYQMPSLSIPIFSGNYNDPVPPSEPGSLYLLSVTSTTAALKWEASTDNRAVKKYNIYYGNTLISSTDSSSTTCFIQGLVPDTAYNGIYVRAVDEAGNQSKASPVLYFTTSRDTQSPTAPANPDAALLNSGSVRLSWEASFDDVKVTGYEIFLNNAQIATTAQTTFQYNGIKIGNEYKFSIRARDAAGNRSERVDFEIPESPSSSRPGGSMDLRKLIERFIRSGDLKHPLGKKIYNFLNQAEHHMKNKREDQALHHLQKIQEHLNKKSAEKHITHDAKKRLLQAIDGLLEKWED